jgi:hypothetical protein
MYRAWCWVSSTAVLQEHLNLSSLVPKWEDTLKYGLPPISLASFFIFEQEGESKNPMQKNKILL